VNKDRGIYRESFHLKLGTKTGLLPQKLTKFQFWPTKHMHQAPRTIRQVHVRDKIHVPGA